MLLVYNTEIYIVIFIPFHSIHHKIREFKFRKSEPGICVQLVRIPHITEAFPSTACSFDRTGSILKRYRTFWLAQLTIYISATSSSFCVAYIKIAPEQ